MTNEHILNNRRQIIDTDWHTPLPQDVPYDVVRESVDSWIRRQFVVDAVWHELIGFWPIPANRAAWADWRAGPGHYAKDPTPLVIPQLGIGDRSTPCWIGLVVERQHKDWTITLLGTVETTFCDLEMRQPVWSFVEPFIIQSGAIYSRKTRKVSSDLERWYRQTLLGKTIAGRTPLETDTSFDWREKVQHAVYLHDHKRISWETIAKHHIGISVSQLREWRRRYEAEC